MSPKQKEIIDRIAEIRDRMEDAKCELTLLKTACEQLKRERDAAIKRAEKAESEAGRLGEIVAEHDGIECAKHDLLVRDAVREVARLRKAFALYGNPTNWRFSHDQEGNLIWITSIGPDYAMEILNGAQVKTPNNGTLTIKKT